MRKKDVMLHKQLSLGQGENLMQSQDPVAKEAIETKIAEPDHTAIRGTSVEHYCIRESYSLH